MVLPCVSTTVAVNVFAAARGHVDGIGGASGDCQRNRLHGAGDEIQRLAVHIAVAGKQRGYSRSVRRDFDLSRYQSGYGRAVGGMASVVTSVLTDCQVNGPTVPVMSSPPLMAVAW